MDASSAPDGQAPASRQSLLWNVAKGAGILAAVVLAGGAYLWKANQRELRAAANQVKRTKYIQTKHRKKAERGAQSVPMLEGVDFVDADGKPGYRIDESKEVVVLYVTASWCPPCQAFTPMLVRMYEQLVDKYGLDPALDAASDAAPGVVPFEVAVVSVDSSADAMLEYMRNYNMPWLAAAYEDRPLLFSQMGEVSEIPTVFVISTRDSRILHASARTHLLSEGVTAFDKWLAEARGEEWVDPNDPDRDHPYPAMRKLESFRI